MSQLEYIRIYREQFRSLRRLDDERLGQVVRAYLDFAETGRGPQDLDLAQQIIMDMLTEKLERDQAEYDRVCERNRQNISRRWHKDPPAAAAMKDDTSARPEPMVDTETQAEIPQDTAGIRGDTAVQSGISSYATKPNPTKPNQTQPNPTEPNPTEPNRAKTTTRRTRSACAREDSSSSLPQDENLSPEERMSLEFAEDAGLAVKDPKTGQLLRQLLAEYGVELFNRGITSCLVHFQTSTEYLQSVLPGLREEADASPGDPARAGA